MMKPTIKHAITKCGLLVVSSLLLSGCFELNFPDTNAYYYAFSNRLSTIKTDETGQASSMTDYSIQEYIFNDDTVNNMEKARTISSDYYEYLSVRLLDEMVVNECAIYIKSDEDVDFVLRGFIVDNLPEVKDIRAYNRPRIDPETHKEIPYSDDLDNPCFESMISLKEGVWTSFYIVNWIVEYENSNTIKIKKDQYFLFQILNNTGYGADINLEPVCLTPVNLIIAPVN